MPETSWTSQIAVGETTILCEIILLTQKSGAPPLDVFSAKETSSQARPSETSRRCRRLLPPPPPFLVEDSPALPPTLLPPLPPL